MGDVTRPVTDVAQSTPPRRDHQTNIISRSYIEARILTDIEFNQLLVSARQRGLARDGSRITSQPGGSPSLLTTQRAGAASPKFSSKTHRAPGIRPPPGHLLLVITEFLFSTKTNEQVFKAAVSDMRVEHADALAAGRVRKARWIHVRGVVGVLMAATGLTLGGVMRFVAKAYRGVIG